ncbi:hypothetical protein [Endozoicomonas ascidiicola]|uniref:hypothetical protein n=1 Tax=Endozoicomonas ascidiicola TaxID=1698521 RepID=UPI00082D0E94|nr:hypothetical protein [Endozoicomonas ascidiicola]
MTPREIFNKVSKHLLQQNTAARGVYQGKIQCVYHAPEGKKCAIGCLIDPKHYQPQLEGQSISNALMVDKNNVEDYSDRKALWLKNALADSGVTVNSDNIQLLEDLQVIHDSVPPTMWEARLNTLENELNYLNGEAA